MKMSQISSKTLAAIEEEFAKWAEFLNVGVGLLSFSLAISCLGTPKPYLSSFISLVFLFVFMKYSQKRFPSKILELRKADLAGVDEVAFLGIESKYFSFKSLITNCPVFLVGYFSLGGVCFYYGVFK
jgi:hypothetical protein